VAWRRSFAGRERTIACLLVDLRVEGGHERGLEACERAIQARRRHYLGTTAVVSISTLARASIRPLTSTTAIAG
jgi:hypothetical protein